MREPPQAPNLLATAREVVLNDLLPHLPEAQKFAARMVANAMAIAAREAAQDPSWPAGMAREIAQAMDYPAAAPPPDVLRRFARDIRAGACDPGTPRHDDAARLLRQMARLRCAVSAPRALGL